MHRTRLILVLYLLLPLAGCITTKSDDGERTIINLGWLIGGIAMAVDGDDRDDHEHWFHDDCDCDCKCH